MLLPAPKYVEGFWQESRFRYDCGDYGFRVEGLWIINGIAFVKIAAQSK